MAMGFTDIEDAKMERATNAADRREDVAPKLYNGATEEVWQAVSAVCVTARVPVEALAQLLASDNAEVKGRLEADPKLKAKAERLAPHAQEALDALNALEAMATKAADEYLDGRNPEDVFVERIMNDILSGKISPDELLRSLR